MAIPRSQRLLDVVQKYEHILIVAHDNPDPDAIASGWAIGWMVREQLGRETRLVAGGGIVRAENRQMVELLEPPVELVDELPDQPNTAAVIVDCSPDADNQMLFGTELQPVGVIDHHQDSKRGKRLPFRDVRPSVAASASIASSYLREQQMVPHGRLATALLYAIRTETKGSETHYSRLDRRMVSWLSEWADPSKIAQIENAPLSNGYYSDLVLALQSTFVYDTAALCFLPRAEGAEIIGEVADLIVRGEAIEQVLCAAVINDELLLSVRTDRGCGSAAELARTTLRGLGQGGGHQHRAGGKIRLSKVNGSMEALFDELRNRWLSTCGIDRQRGTRLVARRDIVRHL
jgi:nanoRNase/pAp phosphatase (c-di-AMP/oligoRNAs hydrolase)